MMYNNKIVAAIKVNGKILREHGDTVYVPFGSEYQIALKNLNSTRALIRITIDGEHQCPSGIVIDAGMSIDLARSIKNRNLTEGNAFKFIERTATIESHRGVKIDDGLICITCQFEKPAVQSSYNSNLWHNLHGSPRFGRRSVANSSIATAQSSSGVELSMQSDAGITVPGSKSNQQFTEVSIGDLELETHVIIFKLVGETAENQAITKPITVKTKKQCVTCGKLTKATDNFCGGCGTAVTIY